MCLVALAIDDSHRFPLVVAANRDEFFKRPAARLGWWSSAPGVPDILGGRDLESGGTWLGLTAAGRLAFVTNVRQPGRTEPNAPSRGEIVPLWLRGDMGTDRFWTRVALSGYNGFNLVAADFRNGECFWASNQGPHPMRLERGVYGLSNAAIDTPWPKVVALKSKLRHALPAAESAAALASALFEALSDRRQAPDDSLPATGVSLEIERELSPALTLLPPQIEHELIAQRVDGAAADVEDSARQVVEANIARVGNERPQRTRPAGNVPRIKGLKWHVGIDRRVERSRDGAVERHGDGGGGGRGTGWRDPEDTERCRGGHGETADGDRGDGVEGAHKALSRGS